MRNLLIVGLQYLPSLLHYIHVIKNSHSSNPLLSFPHLNEKYINIYIFQKLQLSLGIIYISKRFHFCAPLEKGGILFWNCRSVGMSFCRSVDQVLSAQYLLTPSLDQYQTWCRGCPQWVDDPYWFSGHMFKGQGQTTLLSPVLSAQYLLNLSLDQYQT